jgi:predicted naringenin-chalcone synthase
VVVGVRTILGTLVGGSLFAAGCIAFRVAGAEPVSGSVGTVAALLAVGIVLLVGGGTILGWTVTQLGQQEVAA